MKPAVPLFIILVLSTPSISGSASEPHQNLLFAFGQDSTSCGSFIDAINFNSREMLPSDPPNSYRDAVASSLVSWIDGFLSGANYMDDSNRMAGATVDAGARVLWIRSYCQAHPLASIMEAAIALRKELIIRRK